MNVTFGFQESLPALKPCFRCRCRCRFRFIVGIVSGSGSGCGCKCGNLYAVSIG